MKKVIFRVGDENRVVVEQLKGNGIDESIFSEQYHKALHVINSYLSHRSDNQSEPSDFNSNVFAFVGERGSGKTSCMTSVAKYLESNDISDSYPCLKSKKFYSLQLIDPTFFCNDREFIIGHILSQLLKDFKDTREKKKKTNGDSGSLLEQDIIDKFQQVSSNIDCLRQDNNMTPDDMEYLNQLSSAVNLRDNIRELVKKILLYKESQDAIYIIPIDDIDMNKEGVTRIIEDIRKYLSNENLLVLVSVHLDQLVLIEKQEYFYQYKTLLDRGQILPMRIDEMTEKFMDKFLPHAHRIIMPEGSSYLCTPMEIIDGERIYPYASVRQGVCEMIFAKTRYLFYNSNDTASRIIPRNLRNLRHFIGFLYNMADYNMKRNGGNAIDASGLYNKSLFKNYFFNIWCGENLEEEMRQDVMALLSITDITLFNSRVIEILCRYFNDLKPLTEGDSPTSLEILDIKHAGNNNYNFSVGDALNIIFLLEGLTSDELKCNLLFLLKSIYSIKLYEFYDDRTEERDDDETEKELLLDERIASYNLSNYEKIVAGSFINPVLYHLLPYEKYPSVSRQYKAVNLAGLIKLISNCVNHWEDIPANHIRLCEFFMLSIPRSYDSKNRKSKIGYIDSDYRIKPEPYYAKLFHVREVNGCFDANAILFNSVRVEQCYKRFPRGDEFFAKADAESDIVNSKSIWAKFKLETLLRNGQELDYRNFELSRWLSWASIRNAEILQQLLNVLSFSKHDARHAQGNRNILANYYDRMSKFSIMNYDHRGDNGEFFKIDYGFTKCFAQVLRDSDQDLFDDLFVSVPEFAIPYKAIFDSGRHDPYNKKHVRNKLLKYGSSHNLELPKDIIDIALNEFEGETIPVQNVVALVNRINTSLNEDGSAEENA